MAKFHGSIGYAETKETSPGVWEEVIVEKNHIGDLLKMSNSWKNSENLNDDLTINNQFSILADSFAYKHFPKMRYIKWMGASWKITKIDVQRPRLILTVGGVYNG